MRRFFLLVHISIVFLGGAVSSSAEEISEKWDLGLSLGATLTDGNSDTLLLTAGASAQRKWEAWELLLGAEAAYGESEGERNNQKAKGAAQGNFKISGRTYGLILVDMVHDDIAGVDYRLKVAPGVGCLVVKQDGLELKCEAGPAYIRERLGTGAEDDICSLRAAERLDWKMSKTAKIWQLAEYLPNVEDFAEYLVNAEVGAEACLTRSMSLRVTLRDAYDSEPAEGREKNDVTLISGLIWKW